RTRPATALRSTGLPRSPKMWEQIAVHSRPHDSACTTLRLVAAPTQNRRPAGRTRAIWSTEGATSPRRMNGRASVASATNHLRRRGRPWKAEGIVALARSNFVGPHDHVGALTRFPPCHL